jgi:hypothetical protein
MAPTQDPQSPYDRACILIALGVFSNVGICGAGVYIGYNLVGVETQEVRKIYLGHVW